MPSALSGRLPPQRPRCPAGGRRYPPPAGWSWPPHCTWFGSGPGPSSSPPPPPAERSSPRSRTSRKKAPSRRAGHRLHRRRPRAHKRREVPDFAWRNIARMFFYVFQKHTILFEDLTKTLKKEDGRAVVPCGEQVDMESLILRKNRSRVPRPRNGQSGLRRESCR